MKDTTEIVLEIGAVSILNIVAVYIATFVYHLNWYGILTVMIVASLITAYLSNLFVMKVVGKNGKGKIPVGEGNALLIITLATSLSVLVILSFHFNMPMALGISLLTGIETSLWKHVLFN